MLIDYTECCGLKLLYDFGYDTDRISIKSLQAEFKSSIGKWPKEQLYATTAPDLQKIAEAWLISKKFVRVKSWTNPHTHRKVTMWLRK